MPCHSLVFRRNYSKFRPTFTWDLFCFSVSPNHLISPKERLLLFAEVRWWDRNLECITFPFRCHSKAGSGLKNQIIIEHEYVWVCVHESVTDV